MTPPITGRDGNVIEADFSAKARPMLEMSAELLYCDELVCLARIEFRMGGKLIGTQHITAQA